MFVTVAGLWLVPKRWQDSWLVACTFVFLFVYAFNSLLIMIAITFLIGYVTINLRSSTLAVACAVVVCLICLLTYRVISDFDDTHSSALLLGFAFYILRAVHFLIDCYNKRISAASWKELIKWFWFLPTLQVGPIHRFEAFKRDSTRRRWDSELFSLGLQRILFGYVKVVLLGNHLVGVKLANVLTSLNSESWLYHYLDTLRYGLLLYFRFAGYSDIAIGFALLLGYRIMENFNYPFIARNILDFWQRWHISLSSWCKDYVFTPVLSLTRIPFLAALASMLILGFWHEISWRYLLWGLLHGVGIGVCQRWQRTEFAKSLSGSTVWSYAALILTQHFVLFSFTLTGLNSMQDTIDRWRILFGFLS
jgi:D-alanyl-lipoteichoic acid acyltransferase DltB (MBOAT superfamily)